MLIKNKIIALVVVTLLSSFLGAQSRLILNNNPYVVLDGGVHFVLSNPNSNAITLLGSGGNIVSESENDVLDWKIGTATGTYIVPFTTGTGIKIPFELVVSSAGVGSGEILFSTHTDADGINSWNNADYIPSGVTNLFGVNGLSNNSAFVIDRFWTIEAQNYTAKPNGTLSFGYNDAERSATGNTIPSSSLKAQYYNTSTNSWVYPGAGTDGFPTTVVSGVTTTTDFYKNWTLSNVDNPLPVELLNFQALPKQDSYVELTWSTSSELNNDYFSVQRSIDAVNWEEIGVVQGVGNSVVQQDYLLNDNTPNRGVNYYRLEQFDFNGDSEYSPIRVVNFNGVELINIYPNPYLGGELQLLVNSVQASDLIALVYDSKGSVVYKKSFSVVEGASQYSIDLSTLAKGNYLISVSTTNQQYRDQKELIIH